MKSWKKFLSALVVLGGMALLPVENRAQDHQNDAPPKPAAKVLLPIGVGGDQEIDEPIEAMQPDDRPLTGFQQLTVGTPPERHSYWIPGISYTNYVQSNALALGGRNDWNSTSFVTGNLSLLQNWGRSQLALNYSGGRVFSSDPLLVGRQIQQLGAVHTFDWRRWQLIILDQFAALPDPQFGFGVGSGLANPGVGGSLAPTQPGLQIPLIPGQSIFTAVGPQYSNTFGPQITHKLTPRGSFTIGGVLGTLRFAKPGNIENNQATLYAGYNYLFGKNETVGLSYRFTGYHFIKSLQAIGDHVVQVAYGKKITGHLALQLLGGPDITEFRISPGVGAKTQQLGGSGSANLSYAFSSGSLSLSYIHGLNNGSGTLLGATTDQITGSVTQRLSRLWSGNASVGYARNRSVAALTGTQNQIYNAIYVEAGLMRAVGRNANLTLNYKSNIGISNNAVCAGPNCGTNFTAQAITVGLSWHTRPFVLH